MISQVPLSLWHPKQHYKQFHLLNKCFVSLQQAYTIKNYVYIFNYKIDRYNQMTVYSTWLLTGTTAANSITKSTQHRTWFQSKILCAMERSVWVLIADIGNTHSCTQQAGWRRQQGQHIYICSARMMVLPQLCNPKLVWSELACGWHRWGNLRFWTWQGSERKMSG